MKAAKVSAPSPIKLSAQSPLRTWSDLETLLAAWATASGEDPDAALRELRRHGPLARLLSQALGIQRPRKKPGPKPGQGLDALVLALADDLDRAGVRGTEKWAQVHAHLDNRGALMGDLLNITPAAIAQRYHRAKRRMRS